ncbi:amidohydrolase [Dactylosporangium fulvum]|uniref:Amidohydrolase n=1 Tax=Dactylosporangium fulvum TaxID=53359 RepID=A0ABY5VQ70_9ACTN|nr:amidohydrolase [Dactylosporangium fulvum]UWP79922.1 amidohydrolase [Dactylosporangium fulvum]
MVIESPQETADRVRAVLGDLDLVLPDIDALYRDLHANPELSGAEARTATVIADRYAAAGLAVTPAVGGHGVIGVLANGAGPVVAVRADFDALPIAEDTGLPYASTAIATRADGTMVPVMHACGHDLHTASLVGAARLLAERREAWSGTLVLIAQPAEESMQGAKAMLADGLFRADGRFPRPDVVLAQHCAVTRAGMVHHRPGIAYSACRNFRITIHGNGAHGAAPHWSVDPVVLAAQTVVMLQTVVSREVDPDEMTVLTVGSVHAGSRPNIIPAEAVLEVTLRGTSEDVMDQLQAAMERIVRGVAAAGRAPRSPDIELIEQTLPVRNDADVTARVRAVHAELFPAEDMVDLPWPNKGSEDFAYFGEPGDGRYYPGPAIPVSMWFYGSTAATLWDAASGDLRERIARMPGQHTPYYAPDRLPTLRRGIETIVGAALAFLPVPAP